jgi:predicted nicotinamide N-methyase
MATLHPPHAGLGAGGPRQTTYGICHAIDGLARVTPRACNPRASPTPLVSRAVPIADRVGDGTVQRLSSYRTKIETITIGGLAYRIRSLLDLGQFSDPEGLATARGISEETWSHFGQVWPAALVLAETMHAMPLSGQRVLEVGCGLAIPGMVTHRRHIDVTVCDRHPLGAAFLRANLALNRLPPLRFHDTCWTEIDPALGRFDIIIGSDVLYENSHPGHLARFIERHATDAVTIVIVDPGRRRLGKLTTALGGLGFSHEEDAAPNAPRTRIAQYRLGNSPR